MGFLAGFAVKGLAAGCAAGCGAAAGAGAALAAGTGFAAEVAGAVFAAGAAFPFMAWILAAAFVREGPTQGKSTRQTMLAAMHAAEQFFPLVHRFRAPPTAFLFA